MYIQIPIFRFEKTKNFGNDDSNRVGLSRFEQKFSYGFAQFLYYSFTLLFYVDVLFAFLHLHSSADRKCHRRFSVCAFVFISYLIFAKFFDGFAGVVNLDWFKYKVMPYCTYSRTMPCHAMPCHVRRVLYATICLFFWIIFHLDLYYSYSFLVFVFDSYWKCKFAFVCMASMYDETTIAAQRFSILYWIWFSS